MRLFVLLLASAFFTLSDSVAQSPTPVADSLYQAQQWAGAAEAYEAALQDAPTDGRMLFRLARSRHMLEQFDGAITAWSQADAQGFFPPFTRFFIGKAYARLGQPDSAFAWLNRAAGAGYGNLQQLRTDTDLDALRANTRFASLEQAVDRNARPCVYDEAFRAFDFWIGDWNVFNPTGVQVGTNTIALALNDCAITEHWVNAQGSPGQSINFYRPNEQRWTQVWVDAVGGHTMYHGTFDATKGTKGAMVFVSEPTVANGTTSINRMTFTPLDDGRVRQYIETSTDDGATWAPSFDGYYVRQDNSDG
ncbi:MAG: hypothetical protein RhofKO_28020 [Rhodothermales bacterium]